MRLRRRAGNWILRLRWLRCRWDIFHFIISASIKTLIAKRTSSSLCAAFRANKSTAKYMNLLRTDLPGSRITRVWCEPKWVVRTRVVQATQPQEFPPGRLHILTKPSRTRRVEGDLTNCCREYNTRRPFTHSHASVYVWFLSHKYYKFGGWCLRIWRAVFSSYGRVNKMCPYFTRFVDRMGSAWACYTNLLEAPRT